MEKLMAWFTSRKRSEQLLLGMGAIALVLGIVENGMVAPLTQYAKQSAERLAQQQTANQALRSELQGLLGDDPIAARKRVEEELATVKVALNQKRQSLQELERELVSAGQMTDVLGRMLDLHSGVKLQNVQNLPVEPVALGSSDSPAEPAESTRHEEASTADTAVAEAQFYRHRVRMTLRGGYLDLLRYLDTVERLPWRVFWDEVALETESYPVSTITLEFYTLSTERAWFKVS